MADLVMFWFLSAHTSEAKADLWRAKFEVPPPGYTGSLQGTVWAEDRMMEGYDQKVGS